MRGSQHENDGVGDPFFHNMLAFLMSLTPRICPFQFTVSVKYLASDPELKAVAALMDLSYGGHPRRSHFLFISSMTDP